MPKRVLAPLALDLERGWILLPDGGAALADRLAGGRLADALATILRCYAGLQRDFAPESDSALALGVADMRAEIMPRRFDEALETVERSEAGHSHLGRETLREVAALPETYRSWC